MLKGVDPSVVGSVTSLTDQQILDARHCYCVPLEKHDYLAARGIPHGFCGKCQVCGEPGHVCHYPGPLPFTGCWCDKHYIIEVREKPMLKAADEHFNGPTEERPAEKSPVQFPDFRKKNEK